MTEIYALRADIFMSLLGQAKRTSPTSFVEPEHGWVIWGWAEGERDFNGKSASYVYDVNRILGGGFLKRHVVDIQPEGGITWCKVRVRFDK